MAGYIGTQAVSVNTTSATISDDLAVGDDLTVTDDATIGGTALVTGVLTTTAATVFNGGFAANAASTISTADNTTQLTLISTDADSTLGPQLNLYRNSASPADNDFIGQIYYTGRNDNSQDFTGAAFLVRSTDVSDGSEDVELRISVMSAGSVNNMLRFLPAETVFNEENKDIDFRVESDDNTHMLFVDAGSDHVNIGTSSDLGGVLNVLSSDNTDTLVVYSDDADNNAGPNIRLWRNSSSPADNDGLGKILFSGEDSADAKTDYASIKAFALDVTNGTEDGELTLTTILAGAEANRLDFNNTVTVFNESSNDLDFRVETNAQANAFVIDGGADTATFTNQVVTMTHGGNGPQLILQSTDADGSVGPVLNMFRNSGSPAVNDRTGSIVFNGENDAGIATAYVSMNSFIRAVGNSSESGQFQINTHTAGSNDNRMQFLETETSFNEDSKNLDFRVESDNHAQALFVDGADGTVTMAGTQVLGSGTNRNKRSTQSTGISGTTNTTIVTSITGGLSSAAASQVIIFGSDNSQHAFMDTINCMGNQSVVVAQSSTLDGSPHGRTYSVSGANLNLQLASGASGYNVNCAITTLNFPF